MEGGANGGEEVLVRGLVEEALYQRSGACNICSSGGRLSRCGEGLPKMAEEDSCMNKGGEDNIYEEGESEKKEGNVASRSATASGRNKEVDLLVNGPIKNRMRWLVRCRKWRLGTVVRHSGEQNLGMPIRGKVRLLLVMEVYEDEGRPTGTMRVCEEDDNGVKWRELGCAERCLSEKTSGSPLILFEDGKEKVRTNDRDVSIVGCSGGTTMLEEEEDEMVAERKSGASSFPCNAVSICNKDGENLSIEARRRSLLGLIPVKISTSKPWDLRVAISNVGLDICS
ncbi:hypothetical protein ACSQ67_008943 [Phaseolus vulgaris]